MLTREKRAALVICAIVCRTLASNCQFNRERIGGKIKLPIFTFINNLIANISYAKGHCCAIAISHGWHFLRFDYLSTFYLTTEFILFRGK